MTAQSLTQDELDDAYHKAIFDCDQALADGIRSVFRTRQQQMGEKGVNATLWNTIRDDLQNVLSQAFADCEAEHMGAQRYDAMIARLWAGKPEASPQ